MRPQNKSDDLKLSQEEQDKIEQVKQEKRKKKFKILVGFALLVLAVLLYLQKSDYAQNKIAALFGTESYYVYVEKKNLESVNSLLADRYSYQKDIVKENGSLHTTKKISASIKALALAEAFLKNKTVTNGTAQLYSIQQGDTKGIVGEFQCGTETFPLEIIRNNEEFRILHPVTEDYYGRELPSFGFSLAQFFKNTTLKSKMIKKKLVEYETLFFTELSKTDSKLTEDVLQSVNSHAAYRNEWSVICSKDQVFSIIDVLFDTALKDKQLKEAYEAGNQTEFTYELRLKQFQEQLTGEESCLSTLKSVEMKLLIDNYGNITGRDIVINTQTDCYRFGYSFVKTGLSVGFEVYVCANETEYLLLDGVCNVKDAVATGDISVSVFAGDSTQEFQVSVRDFAILDLLRKKLMGDIKITSEILKGANIQIELQATSEQQECNFYLVYGGTAQLELTIQIEDAPLQELPSDSGDKKTVIDLMELLNHL